MTRWTRVPRPFSPSDARSFVDTRRHLWDTQEELGFAIERDGRYAGSVDLRPRPGRTADVGFALAPWARGRGSMTATLRLVLPWGFEQLGLTAVHWSARVGNWPSRRVAWAVGFRVEGQVRRFLGHGDVAYDAWVGSLLRDEPMRPAHVWLTPPLLTGDSLVLRAHRSEDAARIVDACSDPRTQRWLPLIPAPYRHGDALAHLEQLAAEQAVGEAMSWALVDPRDDQLLGEIGVFGLGGGTGRYGEIGYWTHPQARGRGLTTQALRLVARHCLLPVEEGGLGLPRVVVRAARGNVASQRVALSAGFSPAGLDRSGEVLRDGSVQDLLRFDLVPEELPALSFGLPRDRSWARQPPVQLDLSGLDGRTMDHSAAGGSTSQDRDDAHSPKRDDSPLDRVVTWGELTANRAEGSTDRLGGQPRPPDRAGASGLAGRQPSASAGPEWLAHGSRWPRAARHRH